MSPSSNNSGMELPPAIEQEPISVESTEDKPEKATTNAAEAQPKSVQSTPMPAPATFIDLPQPQQVIADDGTDIPAQKTGAISTPQFAQDKDLIDKEWVDKAKSIVEKRRDDPFKQSEELTLLKADYMKKRFNKTLKLNK